MSVYGGKVTSAVSGKTSYLIMGANPGETKKAAAAAKGVKIINEEQFFKIVVEKSAKILGDY